MRVRDFSFLYIILVLFLTSCGPAKTINLQRHNFSVKPTQVVWIQVAGLQPEHISILRFGASSSEVRTSFENATCVASLWNYNLYQLRPKAHESFLSQLNGTKNIKNECGDFDRSPFWLNFGAEEYRAGIFETSSQFSLNERVKSCQEDNEIEGYSEATFWRMTQAPGQQEDKKFHYQDSSEFELGETYYDQTCQRSRCFASLSNNAQTIWERFSLDYQRKVLLIQDYTYLEALKAGDISKVREILAEIEKTYHYFSQIQQSSRDFLLILSSAESIGVEMPFQGQEWAEFERSGKNITFRKSALNSFAFFQGASAENFCGIYEEAQMSHRLHWKMEQTQLPIFN